MESLDLDLILKLVGTPFGLAVLCLTIAAWVHKEFEVVGKWKVFIPWGIGIGLSVIMFFLGKYLNFGAYALYEFNNWKDWLVFVFVAFSPGLISNGIYDSKFLQFVLKLLKVE